LQWHGDQWLEIGPTGSRYIGVDHARAQSLVVTPAGVPYVAWEVTLSEVTLSSVVGASRWSGSSWEGEQIADNANSPFAAGGPDGTVFVTWTQYMPEYSDGHESDEPEIYAKRWNGSQWVKILGSASEGGISRTRDQSSAEPSAAVGPDGTLYVAWQETVGDNEEIYVRRSISD
jgi:hypothetical protein